jgi:hypothetical protein
MTAMDFLAVQFLNGLASASDLFLVASGLDHLRRHPHRELRAGLVMLGGRCRFRSAGVLSTGRCFPPNPRMDGLPQNVTTLRIDFP